jgi:hypothetical protein
MALINLISFRLKTVFKLNYRKNVVFWDVKPYDSCKSRRFGGKYRLHAKCGKNQRARSNVSNNWQLLLTFSAR